MKGWKTVSFGILLAITAALTDADMQVWISQNIPWVGGGIGSAVIILRALTSSPIFKKEE